ncbi:MAG TPA: Crp/Fnr family transcriptional regulator [Flavobacteriaceae bacterium]|nr:Crp/Fnr family transcriptional regulator [Flavobacteriaceae bacterium]
MQNIDKLNSAYAGVFEKDLIQEIAKVAIYRKVEAGGILIDFGQYINSMPLLLKGAIKVLREDEEGDELLLYFIEKGDTCAFSLSCCLGHTKSEIRAIAEVDSELLMIPVQKMEEWMGTYRSWRNFVLISYQSRLNEMLDTIDTVAFRKLDARLIQYLREKSRIAESDTISITHQEIAQELYTSRVVVSRLLKALELQNKIRMQRNSIQVLVTK